MFNFYFKIATIIFSALFSIGVISFGFAQESNTKYIYDIVSVDWPESPDNQVSVQDADLLMKTRVAPRWQKLTEVAGIVGGSGIPFESGIIDSEPITVKGPIPCEGFSWKTQVLLAQNAFYERHDFLASKERYLIILLPKIGCAWEGKTIRGNFRGSVGIVALQDSSSEFVLAHELGHALGLGHTNLLSCIDGKPDGAWGKICRGVEYGGAIDLMSNFDTRETLSSYHLWRLGILPEESVYESANSESIRLAALDSASGIKAVFLRAGKRVYWIEYRRKTTAEIRPGLAIYRIDPPFLRNIESIDPSSAVRSEYSSGVSPDIWLLNFDDFSYSQELGRISGSMTLPLGRQVKLSNIELSSNDSFGGELGDIELSITYLSRKIPVPALRPVREWQGDHFGILTDAYLALNSGVSHFEALVNRTRVVNLVGSLERNNLKNYLRPISSALTLRVKDLPIGEYKLRIRAVQKDGKRSAWSNEIDVNLGYWRSPFEPKVRLASKDGDSVQVSISTLPNSVAAICSIGRANSEGLITSNLEQSSSNEFLIKQRVGKPTHLNINYCSGNSRFYQLTVKHLSSNKLSNRAVEFKLLEGPSDKNEFVNLNFVAKSNNIDTSQIGGLLSSDFASSWILSSIDNQETDIDKHLLECGYDFLEEPTHLSDVSVTANYLLSPYTQIHSTVTQFYNTTASLNALRAWRAAFNNCSEQLVSPERELSVDSISIVVGNEDDLNLKTLNKTLAIFGSINKSGLKNKFLLIYQRVGSQILRLEIDLPSAKGFSNLELYKWLKLGDRVATRIR